MGHNRFKPSCVAYSFRARLCQLYPVTWNTCVQVPDIMLSDWRGSMSGRPFPVCDVHVRRGMVLMRHRAKRTQMGTW